MTLILAPTVMDAVPVRCHPQETKCSSDILAVSSTTVFEQQSSLRKVSPSYHHVGAETRS